jgi:hypothetical protein
MLNNHFHLPTGHLRIFGLKKDYAPAIKKNLCFLVRNAER